MKQAILITAYKNYEHLENLIDFFDCEFNIYVHLDKKSFITDKILSLLRSKTNVKLVAQKYKVNWGSYNHLRSIVFLSMEALKDKENFYFHLISGHDYPIKKIDHFKEYFKINSDINFLNSFQIPFKGWANNGGMDRLEYYNLYDYLNSKNPKHHIWIGKSIQLQKKIGFKRSLNSDFSVLYGGSTWWSLNRECLSYVVDYTNNEKKFFRRFKYTLCSEEFYFQSIVMNSSFKDSVNNDSLRYIDWVARNGNNPAVLDLTDFKKLKTTSAFFARKFEYPISQDLMDFLKNHLHNEF